MNKKNGPTLGHNKKSLLKSEVEHIDITTFDSRKIIESMKKMSFTSRDTAKAAEIYNDMIKDKNCSIFLTITKSPLSMLGVYVVFSFPLSALEMYTANLPTTKFSASINNQFCLMSFCLINVVIITRA